MNIRLCVFLAGVILCTGATGVLAQDEEKKPIPKMELKDDKAKTSYALGIQLAQTFKVAGTIIDTEVFTRAFTDVFDSQPLAMTTEEIQEQLRKLQQRQAQAGQGQARAVAERNLASGQAFLEANGLKDDIVTLPSGLQYKVIKEGTGKTPGPRDEVTTHYRGTLINGTEFDNSYKRGQPAKFPVHRVIAGWTEALQLMKEGAKWRLFVPANLAYGAQQKGPNIPPNSTLIFDIELLEVNAGGFEFQ